MMIYLCDATTLQNTIHRMIHELGDAFAALGHEVGYLDLGDQASCDRFAADFNEQKISIVLQLNLYNDHFLKASGIFSASGVHFFFYGTDHPYFGYDNYATFLDGYSRLTISLTGRDEVALARRLFPRRPETFIEMQQATAEHAVASPDGRDLGPLLVGNNPLLGRGSPDPEGFRNQWPQRFGLGAARHINAMIEISRANPLKPLADVVNEALDAAFYTAELSEVRQLAGIFDLYQRSRVRADAIAALGRSDAVICGQGWEYLADRVPGNFLGSVDNSEVQGLIRRSRAVINAVPHYYSCSERVLEAAMMGTPAVTTPSRFFVEEFGDALTYYTRPADLAGAVATAEAADPDQLARARAIVAARHTWKARAERIIAAMGAGNN
ncbi:MAG: glycosyltransferase [Actinomycetota bacterium]